MGRIHIAQHRPHDPAFSQKGVQGLVDAFDVIHN